jgi:hypothetical protein
MDGRTLTPAKSGDSSDWIEIAKNGGYSLITRKDYINIADVASVHGNPMFQATGFGPSNHYASSDVRAKINKWFKGTAGNDADNLPLNARLRNYTVRNTMLDEIGSGPVAAGKNDGFSNPLEIFDGNDYDVAFALSYGEAVNYNSKSYSWAGGGNAASNPTAQSSFTKMQIPTGNNYNSFWLRSPGSTDSTASNIGYAGNVFQGNINGANAEQGLVYPSLWVSSEVFE